MRDEPDRLGLGECEKFLRAMFPQGFGGADVRREIVPEGWADSLLVRLFHPTDEQAYEETVRMRRRIEELGRLGPRGKGARPPRELDPLPTFDEFRREREPRPIEPDREIPDLVGMCLWDVFSDSHEVRAADGRLVDLGSFRGSAGFIAEELNRQDTGFSYGYMDFYMGTGMIAHRADLGPVYRMIFRRLDARDADWIYYFPRIHLVDTRPLRDALEQDDADPEWAGYSPEASFAKEQQDRERDARIEEMRGSLDEAHREAVEKAREKPPPATVEAYRAVYGRLPRGWPPAADG